MVPTIPFATRWNDASRRSNEHRYEDCRELITKASRACFERRGAARTSVAEIAREVGITRELFYYYYANKREVAERVADSYKADAIDLLNEALGDEERELTLPEALMATVGVLRTWLATGSEGAVSMLEVLRDITGIPPMLCDIAEATVDRLRERGVLGERAMSGSSQELALRLAVIGAMNEMVADDSLTDEQFVTAIALTV